jgi:hypothetical protein
MGRHADALMTQGHTLGRSVAVFLTLGAFALRFVRNVYFMKKPLVGPPVDFSAFRGPASAIYAWVCTWGN